MSVWMRGYLDSTQNYLINFPLIIRWTLYNCLNHICPKHSHLWCEAKDITTISKNYSHIHCRGLSWAIFHFYLPIDSWSVLSSLWADAGVVRLPDPLWIGEPDQCRWCVQLWTLMVISRASYLSCTALLNWYTLSTMYYALCTTNYELCTMHYTLRNMHYALWAALPHWYALPPKRCSILWPEATFNTISDGQLPHRGKRLRQVGTSSLGFSLQGHLDSNLEHL